MQFLSIDLEACNRYVKGSVFSIGVVGADENFNIIFKRDIIINPHCKFCTNFRKPIEFSVDKEDVKSAPTINELYDELAELFSGDKVIMAHSANNDMFMLNEACRRAGVPPFNFKYICTQMIYSAVYDYMNGIGLDKAAETMHLTFKHHKADDDAEMALELLKHCCDTLGCTYPELEKKLGIKRGYTKDYQFFPMRCQKLDKLRQKHKIENKIDQQKLHKEMVAGNGIAIGVDSNSFNQVKQGISNYIVCAKDDLIDSLVPQCTAYLIKSLNSESVIKVRIISVEVFDSLLDLYAYDTKKEIVCKNESELDFLNRSYEGFDEETELRFGIALIKLELV